MRRTMMDKTTERDIQRLARRDLKDLALYLAYYCKEDGNTDSAEVIELALREVERRGGREKKGPADL